MVFAEAPWKVIAAHGGDADSNASGRGYLVALNRRVEELSGTLEARMVL